MAIQHTFSLGAFLVFACPMSALSAPIQVTTLSPDKPSRFTMSEFAVSTGSHYSNPFDPDVIAVDGQFRHSDGTLIVVPGFWDGKQFRVRFTPTKVGSWTGTVIAKTPSSQQESSPVKLLVGPSSKQGFVRGSKGNDYLQFDSGKGFTSVGLNLCWPESTGLSSYERMFSKLASVGGNFARIWTTEERKLENTRAGLGRIDLDSAAFYDGVFRLADQHGIRLMYTFDDYRVLAKDDYFTAHWKSSPYNAENGGPLHDPTQFFTDERCKKLYKQKLRYLVARYSAFTSVALWEIWNEQDNIPKPGVPIEWFREMTDTLRSIDPYHHLITTSYSWDDKAEVWQSPSLDLTQQHLYGEGNIADFTPDVIKVAKKLAAYKKPMLVGEFGITWKEPDTKLDVAKKGTALHNAMWASIMAGFAGTTMTWWWDNYLEPLDLWHVYRGISQYVKTVDFAQESFAPFTDQGVAGFDVLGLQSKTSGRALIWVHDQRSTWKNDAEQIAPPLCSGVQVSIPVATEGTYSVEFWDTRTGEVTSRARVHSSGSRLSITLPSFVRDVAIQVRLK